MGRGKETANCAGLHMGCTGATSQYLLVSSTTPSFFRCYNTNVAFCCKIASLSTINPQCLFHVPPPLVTAGCSSWWGVGKGSISFDWLYIYYSNFTVWSVSSFFFFFPSFYRKNRRKWTCFAIPFTVLVSLKIFLDTVSFTVQEASGLSPVTFLL